MARIRSIKPEFFTSEVIASLPISARLTFIGLWTHVDDNGVTVDNPKLVAAALWPLDDDPREALARTSGDLTSLSTAGLITRYEVSGRRYLFVASWDEHQRVSHPSKPRYPRPPEPVTRENERRQAPSGGSPETLASPPEILVPEQGAGNREQGAGSREAAPAAPRSALATIEPATADQLIGEWIDHCRRRPPGSVIGQVGKQIKQMLTEGVDPSDIRRGLAAWHTKGLHPSALPSVVNELMNAPTGRAGSRKPSTTDERVNAALALAAQYDAQEVA